MESELLFTFRKLEVGTLKWCKVKMECQGRFPHISFRCPLNPLYLRAVLPFKIICNLLSFRSKSKTHIDVKRKIHFLFVLLNSSWSQLTKFSSLNSCPISVLDANSSKIEWNSWQDHSFGPATSKEWLFCF